MDGSDMVVAEAAIQIVLQKLDILLSHRVCVECLWVRDRATDANGKLARIQEFISSQYRPPKTTEWSERLLRALYFAEEFIDEFHFREARKRHTALLVAARPLPTLVFKCKLWRDLSALVKKMEELCDEKFLKEAEGKRKKEHGSSSSHAGVPWQGKKLARLTSFWDRRAPTNFFCHEEQKEDLVKRIKTTVDWIQGTSILGEQGTGKTFLARWVYNQAKYIGYESRAWVHVSASMDEREFLLAILKQVEKRAKDVADVDIKEIEKMLRQRLAEINRFLIVLDNMQSSNEPLLRGLSMSIPFLSQGHIIITTEDNKIARWMDTIRLKNLSHEESQKMLAWKLHRVSDAQRLSTEEKDILKMCRGSPLRISLLGGFLSNAGEQERAALAKEGSTMALLDILQLSYHTLPVHLKPCFIYMALFPVAFPIPTRRLVRLWSAEGLLDSPRSDTERERTRQPEDVGETFILELADRNVIDVVSWRADGSPKACQMLTSLYNMIRPIATRTGFLHIHATSKSKDDKDRDPISQQQERTTKFRWLAEHTNIVRDGGIGQCHIRSFLSFYPRRGILTKDINTFLGNMASNSKADYSLLRVLDLEGVYKPSLQGVLHKLVLLRYLGLRSTVLDTIPPEVAHLHHLETLDIKHTNITSLPSSLWKSRKLRHLHLNWFYMDLKKILQACRDNAMALAKLQTLSGLVIGEVRENLKANPLHSLTTLTTLKLFLQRSGTDPSGAAGETVANWISFSLTNLQSLTFGVIQEANLVEEEAKSAGEEKHVKQEAVKEPKPEPATSQIGPLPKLSLAEQHHYLLELYLLGQLKEPIWTELLPGSLRVLTLSGSKLKTDMLPELGGLLRNLRTLRLLANSFQGTSLTFVKDGFPSLIILKIWKLPNLEKVIIQKEAMPHLKELDFRHLDMLKDVEGIHNCKELENIYAAAKKDAHDFVDCLKKELKGTPYEREDTDMPESKDDDEDDIDRDGKEKILYLHVAKERPQPVDRNSRGEKGEVPHVEKERTQSAAANDRMIKIRNKKEETSSAHVEKPKTQSADDGNRDEKGKMASAQGEKQRTQSADDDDDDDDSDNVNKETTAT